MARIETRLDTLERDWGRVLLDAVGSLRFGSVEVVVHDGQVVQIETREKVRFDEAGRRLPDTRGRERNQNSRAHRTNGGFEQPDTGEEKERCKPPGDAR
ncbi:MAG TPA: YezD family protein [Vicinamibacteria bacterium]|jgi:hypothetical protein|nr:YezD family protein [Vicinamibacteria bacterium]